MKASLVLMPFALFLIILPFPGTVAARLLLLLICFCIASWQWWRYPWVRAAIPCKAVLAAWIVVCTASLFYAFDPGYSLGELKNELGYTMMAFFAFFAIAHDRANVVWLLRASGLGLVIIGGWAIIALLANGFAWNEGGGHGGIGIFATYVITMVCGQFWLAGEDPSPAFRRLALALCVFAIALAALTMQRAVWPVIAFQALLALFLAVRAGLIAMNPRLLFTVIGSIAAITVIGLLAIQQLRYGGAQNEQVQLKTDVRLKHWPNVIDRISAHPLTGTGFGRDVIRKAYPDLTPADAPAIWHAHNVFLNYGLEMGVPGVLALAAIFAGFGILFWRISIGSSAWIGIAGLLLVAGVVVRNQVNDFFVRDMSLLFWALTGLFARLAVTAIRADKGGSSDAV
jgi:O-antigen ligase